MIRIVFDPSSLKDAKQDWWKDWRQRAESATDKALEAFEEWLEKKSATPFQYKFNNDIWKEVKDWLLENVFYEKCAYCERKISGYYGDAEHYRPKGAVKYKNSSGDFEEPSCEFLNPVTGNILKVGHPGYFWLAYDWRNLVPACVYCNSGQGKNERFDVAKTYALIVKLDQATIDTIPASGKPLQSKKWPGYYYLSPGMLDDLESPFLLNPLNAADERNPRKHLRFGVRGTVAAIDDSPIGKISIETFRLREGKLPRDRAEAQEIFRDKFFEAMQTYDSEKPGQSTADALLDRYSRGEFPFSAAALDYHKILDEARPRPRVV